MNTFVFMESHSLLAGNSHNFMRRENPAQGGTAAIFFFFFLIPVESCDMEVVFLAS